ncbi:zinc finger CCHC domain-containing protein 7 [Mantella aurantiaca]
MFNNEEDASAYEDELYREVSSSDESVDSEVEGYLYSQVHYCQNLTESKTDDLERTNNTSEETQNLKVGFREEKTNVIIISDNDDVRASDSSAVIILSDSLDEDSVNFSKTGGKFFEKINRLTNQSTPKLFTTGTKVSRDRKSQSLSSSKSYGDGLVQEVLVIRGSSDEEEAKDEDFLTSDSEQSGVENWMLLGRAKEDGDTSIQLNLEGCRNLSEGDNEMEWSIGKKDLEVQVDNFSRRRSSRYYTEDKNVICRNCNYRGHLSKNCPVPKKLPACCLCGQRGHLQYSCLAAYCSNCFMPGHYYQDCTERPYWQKKCHRCAMIGHYADACPEIWRQYHLTVKVGSIKTSKSASIQKRIVYCYNCGRRGHCGYECKERRMYSSVHTSCELIFTYDNDHDIRRRNQRAKYKCKELQESGLLPSKIIEPHKEEKESTRLMKRKRKKRRKESKREENEVNLHLQAMNKSRKKKNKLVEQEAEDFPRGKPKENPSKAAKRRKNKFEHLLFKYGKDKKDFDGQPVKRKKKSRGKKRNRSTADLLTIKQRKKKSKKDD